MNNSIIQKLPGRIVGLNELSFDLWWSWHPEARSLFKALDRPLWKATCHNPVRLLNQIASHRLVAAAEDAEFLKKYDSVMGEFRACSSGPDYGFQIKYPLIKRKTIAYFSMEFAIHSSLPLYAGGLGVLAGDHCKEASDLGLSLVGVGFMYPQGYFKQRITEDGWQEEIYRQLDFADSPIVPVLDAQRQPVKVRVALDSRVICASVWQVNVGKVKLFLLDTHLDENCSADRELSARLYGGNSELRLQQEIVLGIGGVRVLRQLKINPSIWHANEGHTSFMMLERCREQVEKGLDFEHALEKVQATTVFTTHTPVPAGNDVFPTGLMEKYFYGYWNSVGLERDSFLKLGSQTPQDSGFNMTVLGLKTAGYRNGVSKLHGVVCRHMWHGLWPDREENDVPIGAITNGVHVPAWISPQISRLYEKYLGHDWLSRQDEPLLWDQVEGIPDNEIWEARRWLKTKLINTLQDRARERWSRGGGSSAKALAMGALLDSEALTIGFCRRFTDYKRPWLILYDIARLKRILQSELRPVQIVFSGKAHPNDHQGKCLIQQVYNIARDPEFAGRVVFVEDYDLHLARYLVNGVDLWLNTPRMYQEASGTSGMKAALNGVPHYSVLDGWWYEGYNGTNGWAVLDGQPSSVAERDKSDADELYNTLENTIVPLYYDRKLDGVPHGWIRIVKEAVRSCAPAFSARRMLKEYVEQMYLPAMQASENGFEEAATTSPGARLGKLSEEIPGPVYQTTV
jgi:glycogen phosphorylase